MIPNKVTEILEGLLQKTKDGDANWVKKRQYKYDEYHEDIIGEWDVFHLTLADSSVLIYEDPRIGVTVNFMNSLGEVALEVSSDRNQECSKLIDALYWSVRNSVLKVDETLLSVERALASQGPLGQPRAQADSEIEAMMADV